MFVLVVGRAAHARRAVAANCQFQTDFITDYELPIGGLLRNASSGVGARARQAFCPIVADPVSGNSNGFSTVFVDVNDGSSSAEVRAQVCMAGLAADSFVFCGTTQTSGIGAFGNATLVPPLPVNNMTPPGLAVPNGYGWVVVELPANRAGYLHGIEYF